jgi:AcrR family transcriptional regulator
MVVSDSDLTAAARIRNAALEGFARDGVAATSIRDVAKAAGVSAGLVQHHFPSKDALRAAVDEYVVAVATEALQAIDEAAEGDVVDAIAERINDFVRDHHVALLYVARGVLDRDEAALRMFDALAELSRRQLEALKARGRLRPDLDLEWATLHSVIINLGAVTFEPALSRQLGEPFFAHDTLDRWKRATTALFREGEFRDARSRR